MGVEGADETGPDGLMYLRNHGRPAAGGVKGEKGWEGGCQGSGSLARGQGLWFSPT